MPTNLAERHEAAGAQADAILAAANGDREAPPIPGNLRRVWVAEHSKWQCIIYGRVAWYVADMWRDENGYPFWCDGNGYWNGYEGQTVRYYDTNQGEWIPYRDYTGLQFDALPNWQDGWKAVLAGIPLTWNDGVWVDGAGNQYWYENAVWNREFGDDIQRKNGDTWESYRCYDTPGPFDGKPTWQDDAWTTAIGGRAVQWREGAWRESNDTPIQWDQGYWWLELGGIHYYFDASQKNWFPYRSYLPSADAAYGAEPAWESDKWTTTIYGAAVFWDDAWKDSAGNVYATGDGGVWTKSNGAALYTYVNSAWTPKYDGESFTSPPTMDGSTLRAALGDRAVAWDEGDQKWKDSNGIAYLYDTGSSQWRYEDAGTNFILDGGAWKQTETTYEPPEHGLTVSKLLWEIKGHADAIQDIGQINKNKQDLADQYKEPLNNEKEWGEFLKASGEAYNEGGNMAEECYSLVKAVEAFKNVPIIGEILSFKTAVQSVLAVRASYTERKAFRTALRTANSPTIREMAAYAFKKVNRRFYTNIADAILAINDFISKIVTLITAGAAAIAIAVSKALLAIRSLTLGLALKIKGIWKWLKGTKGKARSNNADVVINALMVRDPAALGLVQELSVKFEETWIDQRLERDASNRPTINARIAMDNIKKTHDAIADKMKSK